MKRRSKNGSVLQHFKFFSWDLIYISHLIQALKNTVTEARLAVVNEVVL